MQVSIKSILIILIAQSLLSSCNNNNAQKSDKKANGVVFAKPPDIGIPIGNFEARDTLRRPLPAGTEVYAILKALLDNQKFYANRIETRFNYEAKPDTLINNCLSYLIIKKSISASDTISLLKPDTAIYFIDWAGMDNRKSIGLKEAFRDNGLFLSESFNNSTEQATSQVLARKKWFKSIFKCDNLTFVSYPKLNNARSIAAVIIGEWTFGVDHGTDICILKKAKGKWKVIIHQMISAS